MCVGSVGGLPCACVGGWGWGDGRVGGRRFLKANLDAASVDIIIYLLQGCPRSLLEDYSSAGDYNGYLETNFPLLPPPTVDSRVSF